jgi:hypothetical protein
MRGSMLVLVTLTASAGAAPDPDIEGLAKALPAGWHLAVSGADLTITRDERVRVGGRHLPNEPGTGNIPIVARGPEITLALRYHVAPRWSGAQHARARAQNDKIAAQLAALRQRYRIDDIHTSKGLPIPRDADEQQRLTAYESERSALTAQLARTPRCTLGASSLFDDAETYSQLDLVVEPNTAMREAYAIVELVKRRCR